ncbi:MAG: neutral zinc metallopeptidase [Dehalococcoidia bacterium]|nr:neutral zinc metallopeptidase [Dehalococcoidia bacterium]
MRPSIGRGLPFLLALAALIVQASLVGCSSDSDVGSGASSEARTRVATATRPTALTAMEQCLKEAARGGSCPKAVTKLAESAKADIDEFWQQAFEGGGRRYEPPGDFVAYGREIETACGPTEPDNAFYCGRDHSIYYDAVFLGREFASHGQYAPVFIIAHEWGHLVQANLGGILQNDEVYSIEIELQADCFAGVYMRDAQDRHMVDERDLDSAVIALFLAGDELGTAWNDPRAHGTAGERIDAFNAGFSEGIDVCMD